jgi:uncharacterized membrane protein YphA (DoxX/SURF4 family)
MTYNEIIFVTGRILLAVVLLVFAMNHFTKLENMAAYAKMKGVPAPKIAVLLSGVLLVIGALSLGFGLFPELGLIALVLFFAGVTPFMHDFWTVDDAQQRQNEMIQFLKNAAILGLVLVLFVSTDSSWPLSV